MYLCVCVFLYTVLDKKKKTVKKLNYFLLLPQILMIFQWFRPTLEVIIFLDYC